MTENGQVDLHARRAGRRILVCGMLLMVVYLAVLPVWDPLLIKNPVFASGGIRVIRDDWDRTVACYQRGRFIVTGKRPYVDKEALSEYPPLATVFFALGHLVTDTREEYIWVHSLLMAALYVATLHLTVVLLRRFRHNPWEAYPLLLPGFLYFTVNRFDILPCFLTLLAIQVFMRERHSGAFAVLAAAAMVKWYPFLLIAPFAGYLARRHGAAALLRPLAAFAAVLLVVNAPFFIVGGTAGLEHPHGPSFLDAARLFVRGGVAAVTFPYRSQAIGNENFEGLLLFFRWMPRSLVSSLFFPLQFAGFALSLFFRPRDLRGVLNHSAVCIAFFVLFSKVYSPQWLIWYVPLLCILGTRRDRLKLVGYDITSYLVLTIGYDVFGSLSPPHGILVVVRHALFFWIYTPRLREMVAGRHLADTVGERAAD